jgi:hypothetical protein
MPANQEEADIVEESKKHANDAEDVPRVLKRATDDGKGETEPPPSDWTGYATEGVIREE